MSNKNHQLINAIFVTFLLMSLGVPVNVKAKVANEISVNTQVITLIPGTVKVNSHIEKATKEALSGNIQNLPPDIDYFAITDLQKIDRVFFVSVIGLKGVGPDLSWNLIDHGVWFDLISVRQGQDGKWRGGKRGSIEFSGMLNEIPNDLLSAEAKQDLDPLRIEVTTSAGYLFPWQPNTKMYYGSSGVHENGFSSQVSGWKAVDFLSDGNTALGHAPNRLLASASGTISYKCTPKTGETSTAIRIGDLMYTHLLNSNNIYVGRYYSQLEEIGQLKTGSFGENCGYASQGNEWFHVHWGFPNTGSFLAQGWTLIFSDHTWYRDSETRKPGEWMLAEGSPAPTCPQSGGVILYWNANYACDNTEGDTGYRQIMTTGLRNVNDGAFDDKASSIRIPSGWSVRLHEHDNGGGGNICYNSNVSDFATQGNFPNTSTKINDSVSSITVYDNTNCSEVPPPGNWYVEYFDDTSLTNRCSPTLTSAGPFVFNDWGDEKPYSACNGDNWSARFWRTVHFQSGTYNFGLGSDDWSRLIIGQDLVLNNWNGGGQHYALRTLSEGDYQVTVEFADTLGAARLAAWWQGPGYDMPRESRDPYQWYAEYWGNKELWWDSIIRVNEGTGPLDHSWGDGGPGYGLPEDRFSSRFERQVYFSCGTYRFNISTDDGVKFWVDGDLKLDKYFDQVGTYYVTVDLEEGYHDLILKHYENGGGAMISLNWVQESPCVVCNTPSVPSLVYPSIDAVINDSTLTFSWSTADDASEYQVEVASDEGFSNLILDNTTSETQLTPVTPFNDGILYWRVRGVNTSDNCNVAGPWKPGVFTLDTATPSVQIISPPDGSRLNSQWINIVTDATDVGTGVNSVQFFVYHDGNAWDPVGEDFNGEDGWQVTWDATSVADQSIYIMAEASDFAGNVKRDYDWDIAIDRTAPTCVVDTLASISPRTFSVSWAGNDALSGIEAYDVQYRDNGSAWADWVQGEAATSGSFVGEPGHTYGFQCRAQDAAGNIGSYSDLPDASTTIALDIPGDANGDGEVSGIDYAIWLNHYNQKTDNGVSDGDFNLDGVVSGIDYGIWLLNYGSSLSRAPAGTTSSTMQLSAYTASVAPGSPGNLSLSYENNDTGTAMLVHLSWNDNADNEEGFKISFDVEGLGSSIIDTLANPPDTTVRSETTQSDLVVIPCETADRSVTMTASISAFNSEGASSPVSITENILVPACSQVPVRPTQLTATVISDSQIDLDWADNSTNESGFKIERSLDESTWTEVASVSANVTTYSDGGLSSGTQYYYEVCAFNDAGKSCSDRANAATFGSRTISVPQDYPTISQAMDFANSGDTIQVSAGSYNESFTIKPGIALLGADPQTTVIDGGGSGTVVYISDQSILRGFTITNSGSEHWDAGIWISDGTSLISGNVITGNSMGIVFYCWSPCSGQPRIENNIVYNNRSDGILAHDGVPSIVNNTTDRNGINGIVVDRTGTIILNNSSSGNGFGGITSTNADVQIDHNNVWNNLNDYYEASPGPNDISADPRYASPSADDYHLQPGSPNIDAGSLVEGLVTDIDGEDRPYDGDGDGTRVVDIGADEYVGPALVPPHPPSDLAATGVAQQQIDLIWVDNSANENGFEIKRSLDGSEYAVIASVGIDVTSFSDTGLSPNTTHSYKVCAFNEAGSSCSDVVTAKTLISLNPPSNLSASPISESQIDLAWSDNSNNEDGFKIYRILDSNNGWGQVAEVGADSSIYSDMGLDSATTYYYKVCAFKGVDEACSAVASGTTFDPPASIDQVAINEILIVGTPSGGYQDTTANDGVAEVIEEQESGGKPAKRYSYLEHKWIFDVQPGSSITFNANAWASSSSDGDSFIFAYSVDDVNYTDMFTISANDDDDRYQTFLLPNSASGTVYVRIVDTDRTSGNRSLDRVTIDHMFIRTESAPGNPPPPPSDLTATAVSASQIDLSWSDNSTDENGFQIERSLDGSTWEILGTTVADVTTYADMNLQANTSYTYRVVAYNASGSSGYSNTASATTGEASPVHVGDLDGGSSPANRGRWDATVSITVHDANEQIIVGATVQGEWSGGVVGPGSCVTDNNGQCDLGQANIKGNVSSVTFTVTDVTFGANIYQSADNHDPDGDSDGTSITIHQP